MKKTLFLLILCFGFAGGELLYSQSPATPCNITSVGLELYDVTKTMLLPNNSLTVGGDGYVRLNIVNAGTPNNGCFYAPGKVKVEIEFVPAGFISHYYKYDDVLSFTSAKYSWVYDPDNNILTGINTVNINTGLSGSENVDFKVEGVKVTPVPSSSISDLKMDLSIVNNTTSDNPLDNTHFLRINVIEAAGGPLPVTLGELTGKAENCVTTLKWNSTNEVNLKGYEVETSNDGVSFSYAGKVNASGNVNGGDYQFKWNQKESKGYYRLKIVDNNGSYSYSRILTVASDCIVKKLVQVYPNPVHASQLLKVNLTGYDKYVKADLLSSTGQLVRTFLLKNGNNDLSVDNLAQGFYTLKVSESGTITETFKVNVLK
jgi:hypothetical protein